MMGPTLFDVATITSLSPLGADILTTMEIRIGRRYAIDITTSTYSTFISNSMDRAEDPVIDKEHIAFLFYWLNAIIFYSQSIQTKANTYLPLVAFLIEGRLLCLAKLLLSQLFDTLDWVIDGMREGKRMANLGGPLWFLQLWLSAIF